jgi:surface antigen
MTIRIKATRLSTKTKTLIQILSLGVLCVSFASPALADSLDDQINSLRAQVAQTQAQASSLHAEADNAMARVAQLRAQSAALDAQIRLNQAKYNKITAAINENQVKLDEQKVILSANIKSIYLDSSVTPIEMLASSNNISEFLDQQQYQDKIKTKIQEAMAEVQTLQAQLTVQKNQVTQILADQTAQHQQLVAMTAEANQLAALAAQNAASADAQVRSGNGQIASLKAQQQAILMARYGSKLTGGGSCGGGYPGYLCNAAQDTVADPWGMYNRECVSYTAFKVAASGRHMPYWGGRGNANQWPSSARADGIPVDGNPRAGDVAISLAGPYGHAMYVEAVFGGNIHVSQYNYGAPGTYSEMTISASGLYFIHF